MNQRTAQAGITQRVMGMVGRYWRRAVRPDKGSGLAPTACYTISSSVRADDGGESGTAILDIAEGRLFRLNPTGSRIWQGLAAQQPLDSIARELSECYPLPLHELTQHVLAYAGHLCQLGLIVPVTR